MPDSKGGEVPPVHQIDLSLPPSSRYVALAEQYRSQLRGLMPLFNLLLEDAGIPRSLFPVVQRLAQVLLRRVHSSEENLELQGISRVTQVPMYLLVSFNVVLDLLMGCTSGAARSLERGRPIGDSRMLHFRTLDWDMAPLREVVVQLEFVDGASNTPEKVLATSLTYVGFVGVLTGVRPALSMSLNFRPQNNSVTRMDHIRYYAHNLLVLLGKRQAISSLLRICLFSKADDTSGEAMSLDRLAETVPSKASTAAYLIFSDGQSAMTIEKDRISGKVNRSRSFIVMTNHDLDSSSKTDPDKRKPKLSSLDGIVAESLERRACIVDKWAEKVREEQAKRAKGAEKFAASPETNASTRNGRTMTRPPATRKVGSRNNPKDFTELMDSTTDWDELENSVSLTASELREWLTAWPTTNECTHFSAILDPTEGRVVWVRRYLTPVEPPPSAQTRGSLATKSNNDSREAQHKPPFRLSEGT